MHRAHRPRHRHRFSALRSTISSSTLYRTANYFVLLVRPWKPSPSVGRHLQPTWTAHPPTVGSVAEESVEKCEVVHTSNKKVHLADILQISGVGWRARSPRRNGARDRRPIDGSFETAWHGEHLSRP